MSQCGQKNQAWDIACSVFRLEPDVTLGSAGNKEGEGQVHLCHTNKLRVQLYN